MYKKFPVICALWTLFIYSGAAHHSEVLDLITDCCAFECGRIDEPLLINSDGLDKTDGQFSNLKIVTVGEEFTIEESHESYCMINVYTRDYAMLNLSYYLDSKQDNNTVVIMDSVRVHPRQNTADRIGGAYDQGGEQLGTFRYSRRDENPNVKPLSKSSSMLSEHLNKYEMKNYRIMPNRLFTMAVRLDALKLKKVREFKASIVADKGTAGRTFFMILGVVVVFFVIGVPGSFLVYRRYCKKNRTTSQRRRQVVHFNINANAARYQTSDLESPRHLDRDAQHQVGASNGSLTGPVNQRRRLSLSERIWKARSSKSDLYIPPVLPKHELLQKQQQNSGAQRPISVVSPVQQRVEFVFPGIDPGNDRDSPPRTVERTLQTSRNRVVSHMVISEDEMYDDTGTPHLLQTSSDH